MKGHPAQIQKAAAMINAAQKPVIIAGRGVIISQAFAELKELAEKAQIPVVTTLLGLGSFPESHVLSYRWLGMHGMGSANLAVNNADVIIAIGMRFDDRATSEVNTFAPNAKIIHIDIDPAEIGKNVSVDVPIVGDVKAVLGPLNKAVNEAQHGEWLQQLDAWRRQHPHHTHREGSSVLPEYVIHQLWEATKGEAIDCHRRRAAPDVGGAILSVQHGRTVIFPPVAWGRWDSACRPRWASKWVAPRRRSGVLTATAVSR